MIPEKQTNKKAQTVRNSRAYLKAKNKAEAYVNDPQKIAKLVGEATEKTNRNEGPITKILDKVSACIRLIKAYANGSYRKIPWQSLVLILTAIIYFVMPFDLLPDVIVGFGLIDDAAILTWTINTIKKDIDAFIEWETTQKLTA